MQAFEDWDKREYPLPPCYERGPVGRDILEQRKHVWRAALEWVKKSPRLCHADWMRIREELEGTDEGV